MEGTGNKVFPSTGLALNEHGCLQRRIALDVVHDPPHAGAVADDAWQGGAGIHCVVRALTTNDDGRPSDDETAALPGQDGVFHSSAAGEKPICGSVVLDDKPLLRRVDGAMHRAHSAIQDAQVRPITAPQHQGFARVQEARLTARRRADLDHPGTGAGPEGYLHSLVVRRYSADRLATLVSHVSASRRTPGPSCCISCEPGTKVPSPANPCSANKAAMREAASTLAVGLIGFTALGAAAKEPATSDASDSPGRPESEPTSQAAFATDSAALDDDGEPLPEAIPLAADTLSGHFAASASGVLVVPFGRLQDRVAQDKVLGLGGGAEVDLAFGLTRTVVVGAWLQAAAFGGGNECTDCKATTVAFGPFLRYHLVQGVRFDPWISAGAGYRLTNIDASGTSLGYSGWELLRLQLGGDWYAWRTVGLGPLLEFDAGVYTKRPVDLAALGHEGTSGRAPHYSFSIGARITFDVPGK